MEEKKKHGRYEWQESDKVKTYDTCLSILDHDMKEILETNKLQQQHVLNIEKILKLLVLESQDEEQTKNIANFVFDNTAFKNLDPLEN